MRICENSLALQSSPLDSNYVQYGLQSVLWITMFVINILGLQGHFTPLEMGIASLTLFSISLLTLSPTTKNNFRALCGKCSTEEENSHDARLHSRKPVDRIEHAELAALATSVCFATILTLSILGCINVVNATAIANTNLALYFGAMPLIYIVSKGTHCYSSIQRDMMHLREDFADFVPEGQGEPEEFEEV